MAVTDNFADYLNMKAQYVKSQQAQKRRLNGAPPDAASRAALVEALDIHAWASLNIPPEPRLLGELITPSSRSFFVGRTGLGKTLLAHAMAAGMASGQGFLHWRADRPSRWQVIDGEMPTALIKARALDLIRRAGDIPPGNLTIYALDRAEEFAQCLPGLGILEPINTDAGREFVLRLAEAVGAEGIILDNVMSLISGDQKDEVPWSDTLPLVHELSRRNIAQVWLDHTGHNTDRQYGSATKAWRMDTVGLMTPLPEEVPGEIGFTLSFDHPGKARRRTPDNWQDFQACTVRLRDDAWTSTINDGVQAVTKLTPKGQEWHRALLNALAQTPTPGRTTRTAWYAEGVRIGVADAIEEDETRESKDRKRSVLRKHLPELSKAGIIGVDGETITLLSAP
jgi:hypothetical protein